MQRYIDELQLLHAIRLSVVATDTAGRLSFVNDAAAELYGAPREQLVGLPLTDLLSDPSLAEETWRQLEDVFAGRLWRGDVSLRTLAGDAFLARIVATPLTDADGNTLGAVLVSEDITDLRIAEAETAASEQRLRLAHKAAGLGTWQWDIAAGTNIWDTRLEEIYGLPPGGFGGSFDAWMALLHPDDIPDVIDIVNKAMADPSPYLLKTRVVWPDGTVRSIEAWGEVTTDESGAPTGTIGCVRDVTDEVETQQALAVALDAERHSALRTRLLLDVTADLSGAGTMAEVRQAVEHHLIAFGSAFGDQAALAMPASLTEIADGRTFVVHGYEDLDVADQTVLDGLAAQCSTAAQRADLLARTSEIAEDLQLSLAASPLPHAEDVEIAVHYAAGGSELEHVGGDWYDVVRTRDGRLAFVVGDVMGRGVRAATTMIRVRAGLRGLITADPAPESLLAFADDLLARDAPDQLVTAAAALLDPRSGELRLCLAGHIPLIAVHPDGTTTVHGEESGIPLGVQTAVERRTETLATPPGTVLVLVTDGVVESRLLDLSVGIDRLRERAAQLRDRPLDELVAGLAALADTSMRDDVTVLAVRVT